MTVRGRVPAGVAIRRGVEAATLAEGETEPQVEPAVARRHALRAALGAARCDRLDLVEVCTDRCHRTSHDSQRPQAVLEDSLRARGRAAQPGIGSFSRAPWM